MTKKKTAAGSRHQASGKKKTSARKRAGAAAPSVEVAVVADAPAVRDAERTADRVERARAVSLVRRALNEITLARNPGNRAAIRSLPFPVLLSITIAALLDGLSIDQVMKRHKEDLTVEGKDIARANLARFLAQVSERHIEIVNDAERENTCASPVREAKDLAAKSSVVIGMLLAKMAATIETLDPNQLLDKSAYPILRALEISVDAAKMETDSEYRRAMADRVRAKIDEELSKKPSGRGGKGTMTRAQIMAIVGDVYGVGNATQEVAA